MAIRQSALEKRWYYRVAKVFFGLVPLVAVAAYFYIHQGAVADIISLVRKSDFPALARTYGIYFGFWIIGYPVIMTFLWQMIAYIVFGGVDYDLNATKLRAVKTEKNNESRDKGIGPLLLIIVIVLVLVYVSRNPGVFRSATTGFPSGKSGNSSGSAVNGNGSIPPGKKCIPTGCGSYWRCSGTYYVDGTPVHVNGACFPSSLKPSTIFPSWTGTCRQCP